MDIRTVSDEAAWDDFLIAQRWSPFLQSATMAHVYEDVGQRVLLLGAYDGAALRGICLAHLVPARRGKHLAVPYGPVIADGLDAESRNTVTRGFIAELGEHAREEKAAFLRLSPFLPASEQHDFCMASGARPAPHHLLAEDLWILPLAGKSEEDVLAGMRKTTRNLIRRAEKEGVTIRRADPQDGIGHFLKLHEETRQRHHFTPYTSAFFRAQVERFSPKGNVTVYLAEYQGHVIASSIHMHFGGETSYHHGASASAFNKIPASYLLQWTAIRDAMRRGDRVYNFWGIAPEERERNAEGSGQTDGGREQPEARTSHLAARSSRHPFAGITTFKTGFGGERLNLMHCVDVPLRVTYHVTRAVESYRRWRRGF